ncbi:MAG: glutathione S-transferase N-terminal domain-containing protein [Coxiellaceae bacterium]|nr:glutathione S-transferase N-terminal domain-containing protein [Coxiellaceae bacterium]
MSTATLPILYSFRRCPYTIRTRMALIYAGVQCELREVWLKEKPAEMLEASPKGTVPVLVLADGTVLEESREIMRWAIQQNDPDLWGEAIYDDIASTFASDFSRAVMHYKYPERYLDENINIDRQKDNVERYIADLEHHLEHHAFVVADHITLNDVFIFPFFRQCRLVDADWFDGLHYPRVQAWLDFILRSDCYLKAMEKVDVWQPGQAPVELFQTNEH